ncbi:uncharacterized protein [Spinacia oleracea]|uniref:Uncharacterized protein n=1 Tax=Spinacia oleracea TaxID=3562 RepID=A0A9R0IWT9_SPIOL|nr:uncharacterized protein LOC110795705 [Spinacia oleracea]
MFVHHHLNRRRRVLFMLIILASISCLHTQVFGGRPLVVENGTQKHKEEEEEESISNDEINVGGCNYNNHNSTTTSPSDFEGFVANSDRVVPTGPDPLHNRDDQT